MWKILVVDDNYANRQLLQDALDGIAKCDMASSGKEAIEAFNLAQKKEPYQLILLDIAMPDMDGLTFLKVLRETEKNAGVQLGQGVSVFMVTAHKEMFKEAFSYGCDDFVVKPIDPDQLLSKIEAKLGPSKS